MHNIYPRDGHFDAAAYCALCDTPVSIGPLCDDCAIDDDHLDDDVSHEGYDDGRWD